MRFLLCCIAALGILVLFQPLGSPPNTVAYAQDSEDEQTEESEDAESAGDETSEARDNDVLSTELSGVDSLDVAPHQVDTQYQGGHRRIQLERSVFRRAEPFRYASNSRRDPFRALIVDEKKEGEIQTDLLRVDKATLTGVVWSEGEYLGMVRDDTGTNFFLREGDPVFNGRVTTVTQSQIVFDIVEFGDYQQVVLKVQVTAKSKG